MNNNHHKNIIRNGLRPGDVGYDGYDLDLFKGVFVDDDEEEEKYPDLPVNTSTDFEPFVVGNDSEKKLFDSKKKVFFNLSDD